MPLLCRCRSLFALLLMMVGSGWSVDAKELTCGIATGFPPYQYQEGGRVEGFDADVVRLVVAQLGDRCLFVQDTWDTVFNRLRYGKLDLVVGMEINPVRQKYFAFTREYMTRQSVIFVNADSSRITSADQLLGQVIAGDRSSGIEQLWMTQGIRTRYRIRELESKALSMQLLKEDKVQAAIMPLEVGIYLAKRQAVNVRPLDTPRTDTFVAIAVQKGNQALRQELDAALQQLIASGEITNLYRQQFGVASTPTVAH
ncbi:MAG: transporter substrate-binding domain-containing protein [Aeromonadaceae bacterium]|nr:transporter substrate-binding domain-containing protein [Aeromonadaceae bacterium]